jgi:peptide/nickel transport system substrate-binding protein
MDTEAHRPMPLRRCRIVPCRTYLKGRKMGPSHHVNQDLSNIWLDQ